MQDPDFEVMANRYQEIRERMFSYYVKFEFRGFFGFLFEKKGTRINAVTRSRVWPYDTIDRLPTESEKRGVNEMVRLIMPCMSGQASGALGKILIFKRRLSTNVVGRYFIPRNPRSPAQTIVRTRQKAALVRWKAALQGTRDAWNTYAKQFGRKGYNRYLSAFMIYMRDNAEAEPGAPFLP